MKKNTAQSLRQIALSMGSAEIEATTAYIAGFNRKYGDYEPKTLKLFSYILDNTEVAFLSDSEVKSALFPSMDESTFTKLVARLKEKVFESMQLDVNLSRGSSFAASWLARQRGRKGLISAEILSIRGLRSEADEILRRVLREGQKYALYDLAGAASQLLYVHVCAQWGSEKGEDLRQMSEHFNRLAFLQKRADVLFYQAGFKRQLNYDNTVHFRQLAEGIKMLMKELNGESAPGIEYVLSQLKLLYWEGIGSFEKQAKEAEVLEGLLHQYPGISSDLRRVNVALQSMTAAFHLRDFSSAERFAELAMSMSSLNHYNGRKVAAYQVVVLIQLRKFDEAGGLLTALAAQPLLRDPEVEYVQYLNSYLEFQKGNAFEAKAALKSISVLRRQKQQDWIFGIEMYEIQLRIGLGQFDLAEDLIHNLKRRVERMGEKDKPSPRTFTAIRILHSLSVESFNFKVFWGKHAELVGMLNDPRPGYRWDPFGPEVSPLEGWLANAAGAQTVKSDFKTSSRSLEMVEL